MKKHPINTGVVVSNPGGADAMTHKTTPTSPHKDHAAPPDSPAGDEPARLKILGPGRHGSPPGDTPEAIPESKRWDPVPGSVGHQEPESPSEDEDDEGRSETEQLVEDGAVEAAREQTQQSSRADDDKDRRGL